MSDDASQEEGYDIYCNAIKDNYSVNISYDIWFVIACKQHIQFLARQFENNANHNNNNHWKKSRKPSNKKDTKNQSSLYTTIIICLTVLFFYTIGLIFKLLNHILCDIDSSATTLTGLIFITVYSSALTGALTLFSMRLKLSFRGTMHEPSNLLYGSLIGSTIIFIFVCLFGIFLFALIDYVSQSIIQTLVPVLLSIVFVLYVLIIAFTMALFATTLRKVGSLFFLLFF